MSATMQTVSDVLGGLGASDGVINAMGPTVTIVFALIGGFAAAQIFKFPLDRLIGDPWHGYVVRMTGVGTTFGLAHYLSNHLTVPIEFTVAVLQPTMYELLRAAANRFVPWAAPVFRSVDETKGPPP
jgi:hypothetical protein